MGQTDEKLLTLLSFDNSHWCRFLVAGRDIMPGELLAVEQSHVALLGTLHYFSDE
jgi:hypothetical protein